LSNLMCHRCYSIHGAANLRAIKLLQAVNGEHLNEGPLEVFPLWMQAGTEYSLVDISMPLPCWTLSKAWKFVHF